MNYIAVKMRTWHVYAFAISIVMPSLPVLALPLPFALVVVSTAEEQTTIAGCPVAFKNPVVPNACLGPFRHGALIKKIGSGKNEILELAPSPADATHTHPGVDLVDMAKGGGSPIYSFADGLVVDVISDSTDKDFKYLGYMVRLKHADTRTGRVLPSPPFRETETLYLHMLEPPAVKIGSVIPANTLLGKVGNSGAAWGFHTHFEVRHFRGRYQPDRKWNDPPNIYGLGIQTDKPLFTGNWTDPVFWLHQFPAELVPPTQLTLDLAVNAKVQNIPNLPAIYSDPGACPGEHCRYDIWIAQQTTPVHSSQGSSTIIFTLNKGQKVTAVTGTVLTKPGRIRILHPVNIHVTGITPERREIYVLTYRGEGYWKIWLQGKVIDSVQLLGQNFPLALSCKPSDDLCKRKLESQPVGAIAGVVIQEPEAQWWIQIRDTSGRTGWIQSATLTWSEINGIF